MNPIHEPPHKGQGIFPTGLRLLFALLLMLGFVVGCGEQAGDISGVNDAEDPGGTEDPGGADDPGEPGLVLAFPGAEGFGAQATGGRGGRVIKVTNLNDSGPGSLQDALDQDEPRIIVFEVSGVIEDERVTVRHGNVTIAGQTAPGAGITIKGQFYVVDDANNVIVRHLRMRPIFDGEGGGSFDAIQMVHCSMIIFDHISVAFGIDETVGMLSASEVTIQWSTISMSGTEGHPEQWHNYGLLSSRPYLSLHHNLFAHHSKRNPASSKGPSEVRNNVIYNFHRGFLHHNPPSGRFNIVGNYYKSGIDGSAKPFYFDGAPGDDLSYYLADNYIDDPENYLGIVDDPWNDSTYLENYGGLGKGVEFRSGMEFLFSDGRPDYVPITTQEPQDAYESVLALAGAWPRDIVTLTAVEDTRQRTGMWGAHYPEDFMDGLTVTAPPQDADEDGMADAWEQSRGLDPTDGADHGVVMSSGYTAIEEYINGLAEQLLP